MIMKCFNNAVAVLALSSSFAFSSVKAGRASWPDLVLDEHILGISAIAADLSALAYESASDYATGASTYSHPEYDFIKFYTDEPDQVILAQQGGRCYVAFRGTTLTVSDWLQNFDLGDMDVYRDNDSSTGEFCESRIGFAEFLTTTPYEDAIEDLHDCMAECSDPDDCLVLTGHSQGGANANVAAVAAYSFNPIVVTFGQPVAIDADCPLLDNSRFYRYVNWLDETFGTGIGFDLVPYLPNLGTNAAHYGYYILVGEDDTTVYYAGYGHETDFSVSVEDWNVFAHFMDENDASYSYQSRIVGLSNTLPATIGTDGSIANTACEEHYPEMCQSNICDWSWSGLEYRCD